MASERAAAPRTVFRLAIVAALALGGAAIALPRACSSERRVVTHDERPTTCQRDPSSTDFQVCVVDEAGRPLAGVTVYGAYTRYAGSGPYTDSVGSVTTDASGLATFKRPPIQGSARLRPMWAIAERAGWPAQAEVEPGRIVLGPPRSLHGVIRFAKACRDASATVVVNNQWENSAFGQPNPTYFHVDLHGGERAFAFENLGPGVYRLTVNACDDADSQTWSGDVRGHEIAGRTFEVPLALVGSRP